MIDSKYNPYIAKIFSSPPLVELASTGNSNFVRNVITESGYIRSLNFPVTWEQFFDSIYLFLIKNYRNEYVYKNAIANKILLGRHSINTASLLNEFRVDKSKADIVILNGTSSVYEIKTEYDKLDRLEDQINSYRKVFEFINVITHINHISKLEKVLDSDIGLFILTNRYTISTINEPKSNRKNLDPSCIFNSLRKNEYTKILKKQFGLTLKVPNTKIHSKAMKLFCTLPPEIAHDRMVEALSDRTNNDLQKNFLVLTPKSLKAACLNLKLNKRQMDYFSKLLNSEFII